MLYKIAFFIEIYRQIEEQRKIAKEIRDKYIIILLFNKDDKLKAGSNCMVKVIIAHSKAKSIKNIVILEKYKRINSKLYLFKMHDIKE